MTKLFIPVPTGKAAAAGQMPPSKRRKPDKAPATATATKAVIRSSTGESVSARNNGSTSTAPVYHKQSRKGRTSRLRTAKKNKALNGDTRTVESGKATFSLFNFVYILHEDRHGNGYRWDLISIRDETNTNAVTYIHFNVAIIKDQEYLDFLEWLKNMGCPRTKLTLAEFSSKFLCFTPSRDKLYLAALGSSETQSTLVPPAN